MNNRLSHEAESVFWGRLLLAKQLFVNGAGHIPVFGVHNIISSFTHGVWEDELLFLSPCNFWFTTIKWSIDWSELGVGNVDNWFFDCTVGVLRLYLLTNQIIATILISSCGVS